MPQTSDPGSVNFAYTDRSSSAPKLALFLPVACVSILFPLFSFLHLTHYPSLFLFLQISCCIEEPSNLVLLWTPNLHMRSSVILQIFDWCLHGSGCIRHSLSAPPLSSPQMNMVIKQVGIFLYIVLQFHPFLSLLSLSSSLSRNGSRALPFSTWWESCFIYTILVFFQHLHSFPRKSYLKFYIFVGHNEMMVSII